MSKFIDADRLKAEIEKVRKKVLDCTKRGGFTIFDIATADTLAEVLLIIEQFQKEGTEVNWAREYAFNNAEEITPIMAEYVADVFSRKEHLDNISYGYCMEIADVFRRYAERAKQEQQKED